MKKCVNCGNVVEDDISICEQCGFDLTIKKQKEEKSIKVKTDIPTDLIDYPILSFIFGIIALIIPIFIFSFIAIKFSQRPCKPSFEPVANLGRIFGYLGFFISIIFIGFIISRFI